MTAGGVGVVEVVAALHGGKVSVSKISAVSRMQLNTGVAAELMLASPGTHGPRYSHIP